MHSFTPPFILKKNYMLKNTFDINNFLKYNLILLFRTRTAIIVSLRLMFSHKTIHITEVCAKCLNAEVYTESPPERSFIRRA